MSSRRSMIGLLVANGVLLVMLMSGLAVRGRAEAPAETLFEGDATDARRIEISRVAGARVRSVVLERSGGWELVEDGARYPARADRIDPFLEELDAARVVRTVGTGNELFGQFALIEPSSADARSGTRVDLTVGVAEASVVFGETESVTDRLYARRADGDRVVVAQAAVAFYLEQPASFWAYLRLFPESARPSDVVRIALAREGAQTVLTREASAAGERWFVASEIGGARVSSPADERAVSSLARDLADLVGNGFYAGDEFDALPGIATVSFSTADARTFRVEIRASGDLLVARPSGPALPGEPYDGLTYTLPAATLSRILPPAGELTAR